MSAKGQIELVCGRALYLRTMRQTVVYAGLLNGFPTREMNRRIVDDFVAEERKQAGCGDPYLIPPIETPIEYSGRYPFGEPAALPRIMCAALFHSTRPTRQRDDPEHVYCSDLVIVWFQEEFAFPIDTTILQTIRSMDWDRHAFDYEL